jgi:dihydrofolate synthase/folylpolyglutamate synthase
MNYEQCQQYLQGILESGIKFGLDNVRTVLSALGQPHQNYPSVLVAGTNGKGSVCAMLAKILSLHGFRVGLYTSPHLVRVEERFRIGEEPISSRRFCRLLFFLKSKVEELIEVGKLPSTPTYFEMLTCLAFLHFETQNVDIAVLEVGMGGRLDATNVVTPLVSVITTVSRDHQEFLGRTLSRIAFEKAGIIKPRVPVVCGLSKGKAYNVIKKRAGELEAPFIGVFDEKGAFCMQKKQRGYCFSYRRGEKTFIYTPALRGEHQGRNAAVAIVTALELSRRWKKLGKKKILKGIRKARWDGRLEVVSRNPLVVLDGAHNEEGAGALGAYARNFLPQPRSLVFGIMKDKNIHKVADLLFPLAQTIFLTSSPYKRAATPESIKAQVPTRGRNVLLEPDLKRAIQKALEITPGRGSLLITGSLFLVGEVKKRIRQWSKRYRSSP